MPKRHLIKSKEAVKTNASPQTQSAEPFLFALEQGDNGISFTIHRLDLAQYAAVAALGRYEELLTRVFTQHKITHLQLNNLTTPDCEILWCIILRFAKQEFASKNSIGLLTIHHSAICGFKVLLSLRELFTRELLITLLPHNNSGIDAQILIRLAEDDSNKLAKLHILPMTPPTQSAFDRRRATPPTPPLKGTITLNTVQLLPDEMKHDDNEENNSADDAAAQSILITDSTPFTNQQSSSHNNTLPGSIQSSEQKDSYSSLSSSLSDAEYDSFFNHSEVQGTSLTPANPFAFFATEADSSSSASGALANTTSSLKRPHQS